MNNFNYIDLFGLCISIDKIDKIGISGLKQELLKQDFDDKNINQIIKIFEFKGN